MMGTVHSLTPYHISTYKDCLIYNLGTFLLLQGTSSLTLFALKINASF